MTGIWRTLWPYLRRHRRHLLIALGAMIGEVATGLLSPWPLKFIIDNVLFVGHQGSSRIVRTSLDRHAIVLLAAISVAALVITALDGWLTYLDDKATTIAAQRSIDELRQALFSHLQRLSLSFHSSVESQLGDLLSRLNGDIQALQDLAASGISNLVTNGLGLVSAVAVMVWLDWRLASITTIFAVPMFLVAQRATRKMRVAMRAARHQEGRVGAVLQEALSSVKLVQAFGREDLEEGRLASESRKSLDASLEAGRLQARLGPAVAGLSALATIVVTCYGVVLVVDRAITAGELLIFLAYLRGMQSPIRQLAKLSFAISKASAAVERIDEVFVKQATIGDRPQATDAGRARGGVRFDNVVFGYEPGRPVLDGLDLEVTPGEVVAIVGPTGVGKSTMVSLLPRFYDPWAGRVLIDGRDVRDLTLASVRSNVALVLQETLIFRATLADNIAYGRPGASRREIEAAAELAGVGVLARKLPEGYDTVVSERGSSLSGGEKQCIGIARAILKDTPIVILDEPTASMDAVTERQVMGGIQRLLRGRTAFIVAHRLSTVRHADVVAVIDGGKVVEFGRPSVLMNVDGRFAEFVRTQAWSTADSPPPLPPPRSNSLPRPVPTEPHVAPVSQPGPPHRGRPLPRPTGRPRDPRAAPHVARPPGPRLQAPS